MIPYISFFFIPGRGRRESTLTDANRRSLKRQELRHETAASFSSSLPWASGTAPGSHYNLLGIPRYPWVSCAAVKDRTRRPRERERKNGKRENGRESAKRKIEKKRITTFTVTQASSLECGFCRNALLRQESMRIRPKRE